MHRKRKQFTLFWSCPICSHECTANQMQREGGRGRAMPERQRRIYHLSPSSPFVKSQWINCICWTCDSCFRIRLQTWKLRLWGVLCCVTVYLFCRLLSSALTSRGLSHSRANGVILRDNHEKKCLNVKPHLKTAECSRGLGTVWQ